jgi:hypothetical protein
MMVEQTPFFKVAGLACTIVLSVSFVFAADSAVQVPAKEAFVEYHLTLPDVSNPHGSTSSCGECHTPGEEPAVTNYRLGVCTECHQPEAHLSKIHPTDFASDNTNAPVFQAARLKNGRSLCITCHHTSCHPTRENRNMLRGGPWPREIDFCFQCHKQDSYEATNPHQDSQNATLCAYCHESELQAKTVVPNSALRFSQQMLCMTCHADVKHEDHHMGRSVVDNHLKQNTSASLENFQNTSGITLPLGKDGTIHCGTCHGANPACGNTIDGHEKAGSSLLRATKEQICFACHDL